MGEAGDMHPFARRARARARVCAALAAAFAYPTAEQAAQLVASAALGELASDARDAHLPGAAELVPPVPDRDDSAAGRMLRAECTRLFLTYPRPVHLEGRYWAHPRGRGESLAVRDAYRALGLRNKQGVSAAPDHLASELDYLAYVSRAESRAWEGGDAASARAWNQLAGRFVEDHLAPCARGVAAGVLAQTAHPQLRFYAQVLQALSA